MVSYTAFLLLTCCSCLQHTGAQSSGPSALARYKRAGAGKKAKIPSKTDFVQKHGSLIKGHCIFFWKSESDDYNPPLIIKTSNQDIVLPKLIGETKIVMVPHMTDLTISCSGSQVIDSSKNPVKFFTSGTQQFPSIPVECITNGDFILKGTSNQIQMNSVGCENKIEEWVEDTGTVCDQDNGGKLSKIGFYTSIPTYKYYTQINVCFNTNIKRTIWTQHILRGHNYAAKVTGGDSTWKDDQLFNYPADHPTKAGKTWIKNAYETANQRNLLKKKLDEIVIQPVGPLVFRPDGVPNGLFFAKGHLSPNSDFVTTAERRATFHYLNAVPQWHANNNGNWNKIVEVSVQRLSERLSSDLIIISGGHGILHLKDLPISLKEAEGSEPDQVPVPKVLWKVVYNPNTNEGVAFVVNNNPYIGQQSISPTVPKSPCPDADVCGDLNPLWFKANDRHNYISGYTYCCKVADVMQSIDTIPTHTIPTHYDGVDLRTVVLLLTGY